jgi:hypothetical protein
MTVIISRSVIDVAELKTAEIETANIELKIVQTI